MCQGYYRHAEGYTATWQGMEHFQGRLVHPQTWPDDLELDGKKVVVIGSGATAATLIPAIADRCARVTMLQRSPTFWVTGRNANDLADTLRQPDIPPEWTHEIVRRKVLFDQAAFIRRCVDEPEEAPSDLLNGCERRWARASRLRSTGTSARAIGLGSNASPLYQMPTCSRASAKAGLRSLPMRSRPSPSKASS
jgi:cation diffusion facilitator CzcD-associated flavoprotein CzcO